MADPDVENDESSFPRIETRPYDDANPRDDNNSSNSSSSRPITPTTPSGSPGKPPRPRSRASSASSRGGGGGGGGTRAISVIARFRPENSLELEKGGLNCCRYDPDGQRVAISMEEAKGSGRQTYDFKFESVLPPSTTQDEVYARIGHPVIDAIFQGINCSTLAFGATGSGKTFSMIGSTDERGMLVSEPGILPRLFNDIFDKIESIEDTHDCVFNFSFVELYMEKLRDLLSFMPLGRNRIHSKKSAKRKPSVSAASGTANGRTNGNDDEDDELEAVPASPATPATPAGNFNNNNNNPEDPPPLPKDISTAIKTDEGPPPTHVEKWRRMHAFGGSLSDLASPLEIRDAGNKNLYISNCTSVWVQNQADAMSCVQRGLQYRTTAATKQNQNSSRSHAILVCTLIVKDRVSLITSRAQLYVVDLAGSERVSKSETQGLLLEEAKSINLSLFSLGSVITALAEKANKKSSTSHVPYRDSKLTRLLENSLGGNALTYILCACSPSSYNAGETVSTLTFGSKSSLVKTQPRRNDNITVEELQLLLENSKQEIEMQKAQIQMLKMQLMRKNDPTSSGNNNNKNGAIVGAATNPHAIPGTRMHEIANGRHERLIDIVKGLLCDPLTGYKMKDPVFCLDGNTYERTSIFSHLVKNDMISPMTGQRVLMSTLTTNSIIKALDTMLRDEDLLVGNPNDVERYQTPFMAWTPVFLIVSFLSLDERLWLATLNSQFARCVYDKAMWEGPVHQLLSGASDTIKQHVKTAKLPAHKVYTLLKRNAANPTRLAEQLQRYVIRSDQPIALFSSKLQKQTDRFKSNNKIRSGNEEQF